MTLIQRFECINEYNQWNAMFNKFVGFYQVARTYEESGNRIVVMKTCKELHKILDIIACKMIQLDEVLKFT